MPAPITSIPFNGTIVHAEEYLAAFGWHQESDGLWNNPSEKKHGRTTPDLVSPDNFNSALKSAAEVFDALDATNWQQTDADFYHGRGGTCPVDYHDAQSIVGNAIRST